VEWKGKCRKAWLELHAPLTALDSGTGPLRRFPKLHPNFLTDNLVRDTVLLLSGCVKNVHSRESLYREQLTTRLVAHLEKPPSDPDWALTLHRAPVLTRRAVVRAKDYVFDHLFQPISLKVWASELNMNAFHFARSFKATTGLAPYQYVLDQRIQQARLLLEIGRPASEVAARLCFSSASHFGLIFKQRVGLSPSAWKENHMKAESSIFRSLKTFEARNLYRPAAFS
jgi:AraC family transcriptional regulator